MGVIARSALDPDAEPSVSEEESALRQLRDHGQTILQMLLTRVTDAFLHYISALLVLLFQSGPEPSRLDTKSVSNSFSISATWTNSSPPLPRSG